MIIEEYQRLLIKKIKEYILKLNQSNIDTSKSSLLYFVGWDLSSGLTKIRSQISSVKIFTFLKIYLRDLIGIGYQNNYQLVNLRKTFFFKNIIVTWASKKDFKSDGSLNDIYFKTNSKKIKKTLWVVIYMDFELPKKLNNNILILKNSSKPSFSLFYFIKIFYKILTENYFNLKKVVHYSASHSNFGNIVLKNLKIYLLNKKLKFFCMPYEAQPFQQMIISFLNKNNKKVKVLGFVHDCEPLTPNLMYKKNSPHTLLLPGKGRKKYFSNNLNWPLKRLKIVPSFRYYKNDFKNILKNQILLPSGIYNIDKISKYFETFILNCNDRSLKPIQVRSHPAATNQKLQKKLKERLEKIINQNKNKFLNNSRNKDMTIIIGITSLLIVALENGYKVTQICMDPSIQAYSKLFSSTIKPVRLNSNIFTYELNKLGSCLRFGIKDNSVRKLLT